jgi:ribosomal protein S18 acetylase RimI-like enzyme
MEVLELTIDDADAAAELWTETGLTRPWNDPHADLRRAIVGPTSVVLGVKHDSELIGSVMVGSDGHRGWVYYLSVRKASQNAGLGIELMRAAEEWLRRNGAVKVQLMVRKENDAAFSFYERRGYETSDVHVLSKWLVEE